MTYRALQEKIAEFKRGHGLTAKYHSGGPERVSDALDGKTTCDILQVIADDKLIFTVRRHTRWGCGTGRDPFGCRLEDPLDEWEDRQVDVQQTSYEHEGGLPEELLALVDQCDDRSTRVTRADLWQIGDMLRRDKLGYVNGHYY